MPNSYTENYGLSQWVKSDQVLMEDFNKDNEKIDAALADKAEQSELDGLSAAVSALSGTLSQHTSTLTKLGNCQIQRTSYFGNGQTTRTINLPENTLLAVIYGDNYTSVIAVRGITELICVGGMGYGGNVIATWSDKSVKFEFKNGNFSAAKTICNDSDATYYVISLRSMG